MLAIETQLLTKTFRGPFDRAGKTALRDLSLSVPAGTAFGLIGPNGAGKTTFIKALLGIVRPTSGEVRLLGGSPDDPKVRARVGYLPERLELSPALRPPEVLRSAARLKGLRPGESELAGALEQVGLSADAGRKVGTFSKGMKQRLGLAIAFLGQPELLVLDEPTDGLDPLARVEVRNLLAAQLRRGATLFLNSHLLSETEQICDRIGILDRGQLAKEGGLAHLKAAAGYLLRFAPPLDSASLTQAGFIATAHPERWRWAGDDAAALNQALDRTRATGALLVELSREARSLEQVLADALEKEKGS